MVTPAVLMLCLVIKESGETTCLREFKTKTNIASGPQFLILKNQGIGLEQGSLAG